MLEVTCYRTYKRSLSEAFTNRIYIWNSAARGIVKLFSPECKEDQESCHYITITFHYWINNKCSYFSTSVLQDMVKTNSKQVSMMLMHFGHFLSQDLIMTSEEGQLTIDIYLTGSILKIHS